MATGRSALTVARSTTTQVELLACELGVSAGEPSFRPMTGVRLMSGRSAQQTQAGRNHWQLDKKSAHQGWATPDRHWIPAEGHYAPLHHFEASLGGLDTRTVKGL